MHFTQKNIQEMNRVRRLNLINGISGVKSASLIGTRSASKGSNLGIFSSVVHIGSDPALMGFVLRPASDVPRNTYQNILETNYFTINHIHESFIEKAHYTSAKFDHGISEFSECKLTEEYLHKFPAPFVGESKVKYGLKFIEESNIQVNGTKLIIGEVQELILPEECLDDKGYVRLDQLHSVGIGGLNSYYQLKRITSFPYVRIADIPDFK